MRSTLVEPESVGGAAPLTATHRLPTRFDQRSRAGDGPRSPSSPFSVPRVAPTSDPRSSALTYGSASVTVVPRVRGRFLGARSLTRRYPAPDPAKEGGRPRKRHQRGRGRRRTAGAQGGAAPSPLGCRVRPTRWVARLPGVFPQPHAPHSCASVAPLKPHPSARW